MTHPEFDMEALKQWLSRGDIKQVAIQQGISPRQAFNIIKKPSSNYGFINALVARAEYNLSLAQRTQTLRNNLKLIAA